MPSLVPALASFAVAGDKFQDLHLIGDADEGLLALVLLIALLGDGDLHGIGAVAKGGVAGVANGFRLLAARRLRLPATTP